MQLLRLTRYLVSFCLIIFVNNHCYAQMGIKWQKHFGGTGIDESPNIQKTPDGNLLLVFGSKSRDYDCVGNHGGTDVFLMKLDAQGNKIWTKFYGGSSNDEYPDAAIDQEGNINVFRILVRNQSALNTGRNKRFCIMLFIKYVSVNNRDPAKR